MEELKFKRQILIQALTTYKRALDIMHILKVAYDDILNVSGALNIMHELTYDEFYEMSRDSTVMRFMYTIDNFWKFLKLYMEVILSIPIDVSSPRPILSIALNYKLITIIEHETLSDGVTDRNVASHVYEEEVADDLASNLPLYYEVMHTIVNRLNI